MVDEAIGLPKARHARGVLAARPAARDLGPPPQPGVAALGAATGRDGLLFVPAAYRSDRPAPLLVMLHGAGAAGRDVMPMVLEAAETRGVLVLAPDSRDRTWDVILGGLGPDVAFVDAALERSLRTLRVDPARVGVAGFSDGASYALSLGLGNGALFSNVLAFSPGFAAPGRTQGAPRIFVSHGRGDTVLPIERCGRRIARMLDEAGYDLDYREFDGGHVAPPDLVSDAFDRFLA